MERGSNNGQAIPIAYMLNQFGIGGADRQLLELLRRVDRDHFQPRVYLGSASGYIVQELAQLEIPVTLVRRMGGSKLAIARLVAALRADRPAIVHSYMFVANTWARVAGRLAGVPYIVNSARSIDDHLGSINSLIDVALVPLCDRMIVNARAVYEYQHKVKGIPADKLVTIYNGVDLDRFTSRTSRSAARGLFGLPLDRPLVGMVASFGHVKRWDVFLKMIARVAERHDVHAVCAGDGVLRSAMEELADRLGLRGRVHFLGVQEDIPSLMAALDIVALTSDSEGMPNVVLEAMAAGRPVVATRAGGTPEVVLDGETGFLAPLADVDCLAARVVELLDRPDLRAAFGTRGQKRAADAFSFDMCVDQTVNVYADLLSQRGRGAIRPVQVR